MSEQKLQLSRSEREAQIKDRAGFVIVVLAALLAINTMIGGQNSSKTMNNTIAANNQWAWYQAKNMRQVLYETAAVESKIPENRKKFEDDAARMKADKEEIMANAQALEAERDVARQRSPWFTWGGSVLQIGIVLLTASILAVSMPMFWGSFIVAGAGALLSAQGVWLFM